MGTRDLEELDSVLSEELITTRDASLDRMKQIGITALVSIITTALLCAFCPESSVYNAWVIIFGISGIVCFITSLRIEKKKWKKVMMGIAICCATTVVLSLIVCWIIRYAMAITKTKL
jgi:hypothetical protein